MIPNLFTGRAATAITVHLAGLLALFLATVPAEAGTLKYTLELKNRQRVAFQLDLPVQYPGTLVVTAEWTGSRILSFKLQGPGTPPRIIRRSGPSPRRLEIEVSPESPHLAEVWILSINGLAARGAGEGLLTIEIPDLETLKVEEAAAAEEEPPEPEPEPWMVPVPAPPGVSEDQAAFYVIIENLRDKVVLPGWDTAIDPCRWQTVLLQYLAGWRDEIAAGGQIPEISTRRYLRQLVGAVRKVEELRVSSDPAIAGPPPADRRQERDWLANRRGIILLLERDLDLLLDNLKSGFAPRLEPEEWPQRFISCLMACERHFEETARLGKDRASNRELAANQWDKILTAAEALEALSALQQVTGPDPG